MSVGSFQSYANNLPYSDGRFLLIAGRCIRRLVSLTDRVEDLVSEADRRACLDDPEAEYTEE